VGVDLYLTWEPLLRRRSGKRQGHLALLTHRTRVSTAHTRLLGGWPCKRGIPGQRLHTHTPLLRAPPQSFFICRRLTVVEIGFQYGQFGSRVSIASPEDDGACVGNDG